MWHRLALQMGRTVEELQECISSQEFTDWIGYSRIEPFGYELDNWRAAMVASNVVNAIRQSVRIKKLTTPADFYPRIAVKEDAAKSTELTTEQAAFLEKWKAKKAKGKSNGDRTDKRGHSRR